MTSKRFCDSCGKEIPSSAPNYNRRAGNAYITSPHSGKNVLVSIWVAEEYEKDVGDFCLACIKQAVSKYLESLEN